MSAPEHASRAHALLSASSSARWLACPPSAVAATLYESADTDFTREGTLAHEVAEIVARARVEDGAGIKGPWKAEVTPEMVRCAEAYADYIQEQITDDAAIVLLEQRVNFSRWVPGGFGTCDCMIIQGHRLDVIDYKYGQGVAVSAVRNPQMSLYGLGALADFGMIYDIKEVVLHIFQPRINNVSFWPVYAAALLEWGAQTVKPCAELAAKGQGEMCAGDHCRFCPHAGNCPALAAACTKAISINGEMVEVPSLEPWMLADALKAEPMISAWLKAVKDRALAALMNGEEIPGYKVVEGRGSRAWSDEAAVLARVQGCHYAPEEYLKTELLSPAALEKSIGKKVTAELLSDLIVSKPGNPTVAPVSDKRKPFDRLAEAKKDFE
jgi:hypothetical protein